MSLQRKYQHIGRFQGDSFLNTPVLWCRRTTSVIHPAVLCTSCCIPLYVVRSYESSAGTFCVYFGVPRVQRKFVARSCVVFYTGWFKNNDRDVFPCQSSSRFFESDREFLPVLYEPLRRPDLTFVFLFLHYFSSVKYVFGKFGPP